MDTVKMSRATFGFALASLLLLTGSAFADSFTFSSPGNTTWNGVYVNPYQANDNSQTQNNPLTIYCDDWNTEFSGAPTWNANIYNLDPSEVTKFKYGNATSLNYGVYNVALDSATNTLNVALEPNPNPFNRYLEAAWLDEQWQLNGTDPKAQITIAAAEWTLFVDGSNVGGLVGAINNTLNATDVYTYLHDAQIAVAGTYKAPGWDVIVAKGNSFEMQEFLVYNFSGYTSNPEPSTVILLGTTAGLLGFAKWRRKRQA